MATILKGKNKDKEVRLVQWCNDWFMVEGEGIYAYIITPTSIKLSPEETELVKNHKNNGLLFNWFELREDGTFVRRKKNEEKKKRV